MYCQQIRKELSFRFKIKLCIDFKSISEVILKFKVYHIKTDLDQRLIMNDILGNICDVF